MTHTSFDKGAMELNTLGRTEVIRQLRRMGQPTQTLKTG